MHRAHINLSTDPPNQWFFDAGHTGTDFSFISVMPTVIGISGREWLTSGELRLTTVYVNRESEDVKMS